MVLLNGGYGDKVRGDYLLKNSPFSSLGVRLDAAVGIVSCASEVRR